MSDRTLRVTTTFIQLADTLTSEYDVSDFLEMLVDRCGEIFEITAAGVLVEAHDGNLQLVAATSEDMEVLERAEIEHGEGPCLEAYREGQQVCAGDLTAEFARWPNVAPLAVDIGYLAAHAFPLRLRADRIGALNLYRDRVGEFGDEDVQLAQAFADMATIGLLQERAVGAADVRSQQLQRALDSRLLIERAKGTLAERAGISTDEAFHRIRDHARSSHERVGAVCERVLDSDFVPGVGGGT